jgi:catechol 2,3-dioxygenase-like lactoylglutathione lyase family enzyme
MLTQTPRVFPENRPALGPARIVSLVVYVRDLAEASDFHARVLGLPLVADDGSSTRFDAGGVILDLRSAADRPAGDRHAEVAPVFYVEDLGDVVDQLAKRGLRLAPEVRYSRDGGVAPLETPSGHRYWLWEPSDEGRDGPGGRKLEAILSARG